MKVGEVEMDFNYTDYFGTTANTGYEVLLYDGMMGDQTLFQRADMVEAGWTSWIRYWMSGKHCRRAIFPTTPPGHGDRRKPLTSSPVMDAPGGRLRTECR